MLVQTFRARVRRKLAFFERTDKILGGIRKANEPVARQRRAGGHAQALAECRDWL